MLTIADLGMLRDVSYDPAAGRVVVTITPTYSGCPAMDAIRSDIVTALARHRRRRRRGAHGAGAGVDHRLDERRRSPQARRFRHRSAAGVGGRRGAVAVALSVRCPQCGSLDTREVAHFGSTALQGALRLLVLPGAVRPLQGALVATGRRTPVFHKLTVSTVERLTDDAVTVTFDVPPESREDFDFTAGQHLTLRTDLDGAEVRRNYSICAPAGGGTLRVAVKELPGGAFSSYVNSTLRAGDVIDVLTPTGTFSTQLDKTHTKHYAAIAAGSGITPVLSLLSTILAAEPQSRFTLLYGNRNARTVMFLDELADLKDRYPDRLHLVHVFSRETQDVALFEGRIDGAKLDRLLDTLLPPRDVDEWFLCGPFAMVESIRPVLTSRGVDPHHVHFELFHVEDAPPPPRRTPARAATGPPAR